MSIETEDREIIIEPSDKRIRILFEDVELVDTTRAKLLTEGEYSPVLYVPRADTDMTFLRESDHTTHCPWKGDASYFHIVTGAQRAENAVWTYDEPLPKVSAIANHFAFYVEHVEIVVDP